MPLPVQTNDETEEQFIERCLADDVVQSEFADDEQRLAICKIQTIQAEPEPEEPPAEPIAQNVTLSRAITVTDMEVAKDTGGITGYALTWDCNADGFQFSRGAFTKSIAERAGKIPLLISHNKGTGSVFETVGFLTELTEDEHGLLITAEFLDTPLGVATREQALAGGIKAMSIGAKPLKFTRDASLVLVSEAKLIEVTLTNVPVDTEADILSVRSEGAESETVSLPKTNLEPSVSTDTPEAAAERHFVLELLKLRGI